MVECVPQFTIRGPERVRLVREAAQREGKTMTVVVRQLAEERLERERAREQSNAMAARLLEIERETAPLLAEPHLSVRDGDLLYDEDGLPK
jgi:hypothetical protein